MRTDAFPGADGASASPMTLGRSSPSLSIASINTGTGKHEEVQDEPLGVLAEELRRLLAIHAGDPAGLGGDESARTLVRAYVLRLKALETRPEAMVIHVKRLLAAIPSPARSTSQALRRFQEAVVLLCIEEYFDFRRPRI